MTHSENNYRYKPMIDSDILEMWINQIASVKPAMELHSNKYSSNEPKQI
jgi:hypothetical protein